MNLSGGQVIIQGTYDLSAVTASSSDVTWTGGDIVNLGTFNNRGLVIPSGRSLKNYGTYYSPAYAAGSVGITYVNAGSVFENYGTVNNYAMIVNGGEVKNYGTIGISGAGGMNIDAAGKMSLYYGSVYSNGGSFNLYGIVQCLSNNYATMNIHSGGLNAGSQLLGLIKVCYIYGSSTNTQTSATISGSVVFNCDFVIPDQVVQTAGLYASKIGLKKYEMSNHLGNVLTTVSDRRIGMPDLGNSSLVAYYSAVVLSSSDYYAFGSPMAGRSFNASSFRYAFNGKEKDGEWDGDYDFGSRIYDPKLGRFLSLDHFRTAISYQSPYVFANDVPIAAIDKNGQGGFVLLWTFPGQSALHAQEAEAVQAQHPDWGYLRVQTQASWNIFIGATHYVLDIAGMIPVVGEAPDLINGGIYTLQGEGTNAALSFAAAVPILGWGATGAKWAGKALKMSDGTVQILQFSRKAGKIDFGGREQLAKVIGTAVGEEAHHIVPWALRENKVVQKAADIGFHMNDIVNGVALKKYAKATGEGLHGNHPAYNEFVEKQLTNFANSQGSSMSSQAAKKFLEKELIPMLKKHIKAAEKSGGSLNDYFKKL